MLIWWNNLLTFVLSAEAQKSLEKLSISPAPPLESKRLIPEPPATIASSEPTAQAEDDEVEEEEEEVIEDGVKKKRKRM